MTTSGNANAAQWARQAEEQLTAIAQRDMPKLAEMVVNRGMVSPGLMATFAVAAAVVAAEQSQKTAQLLHFERERKEEVRQEKKEKKEKEKEQEWLEQMSAEYKQAYHEFMDSAKKIDKDYGQMLKEIDQHEQKIDDDINSRTIQLSGNRHAYVKGNTLVGDDGQPLNEQDEAEAKKSSPYKSGHAVTEEEKKEAERKKDRLEEIRHETIDAQREEQGLVHTTETHGVEKTEDVKANQQNVEKKHDELRSELNNAFADTRSSPANVTQQNRETAQAQKNSLDSWGDQNASPANTSDHGSYATKIDGNVITACSLKSAFCDVAVGSNPPSANVMAEPASKISQKPVTSFATPS